MKCRKCKKVKRDLYGQKFCSLYNIKIININYECESNKIKNKIK